MPARRPLRFANLDEIMPEVDRLRAGHSTVGNWSMGQICNHLAGIVEGSVRGFPVKAPWLIRKLVGPVVMRRVIRKESMPEQIRLPEDFRPRPGLDADTQAEALRDALRAFADHDGPMAEHPFGGALSREEWGRLHCVHCAHHLSFVLPAAP